MDKLKAMHTFVTIVDSGSLSAAALRMHCSLPSVVRSLAALETHLGVRLLHRTTRRISLSLEGRRYLDHCRAILSAMDEAEAQLQTPADDPQGHLVITAPVLFGQLHVAPLITRFVARYPNVSCQVLLLDRVTHLLEEGIDVGIRIGRLADSSLIAQPLGSLRRMVVASPDYLARHGTPNHPKALLQRNCILLSSITGPSWTFRERDREFSVPVQGNLDFNHAAPALDACLQGMGVGLFISYQVQRHIERGDLQIVLEPFEPEPRPIHIVYPHSRLLPARTRAFINWVKQELNLDGSHSFES